MVVCLKCGNQAGDGALFCDQCGAKLPTASSPAAPAASGGSIICQACGAGNVPGEAYCEFCGSPLQAPTPQVQAAPAPVAAAPAVPAPESAATVAPAADQMVCPSCGVEVLAGEAFCANCGASLAQPPLPPEPVVEPEPVPAVAEPVIAAPEAVPAIVEPAPAPVVVEEPSPVPETVVEPAPVIVPPAPLTCPKCGQEIEWGDKFCSNCGSVLEPLPAPLSAAEEPAAPAPEAVEPPPPAPAGPRLIVASSGAEIPLAAKAELLIGREDPVSGIFPDVDLTPHGGEDGGVSRRHARLLVEGGVYSLEDLNSTNATFVNKQRLVPKTRQVLQDGDEVRFGRVATVFKTGA